MRTLVVCEKTAEAVEALLRKYRSIIDGAEIRLDFADAREREGMLRLPGRWDIPLIATARLPADGGGWEDDEGSRLDLLLEAADRGFAYVDLEVDRDPSIFRELRRRLEKSGGEAIASWHKFGPLHGGDGIEGVMDRIVRAEKLGAVPKVAVFLEGSRDLLSFTRMALRLKEYTRGRILIAMGEYGVPVRIAYRRYGSLLSYCAPRGRISAPGQLSPEDFEERYHLSRLSGMERLFGIIGNPVLHTKSPDIHNAAYRKLGLDALYVPFPTDNLDSFFEIAGLLGLEGFSVTVPFKERVLDYLDSADEKVKTIGSCNTVVRDGTGWRGTNTDLDGFLDPLKARIGNKRPGGKSLIIGAGGAARTIASAIAPLFDHVAVANRNPERAIRLAAELLPGKGEGAALDSVMDKGPYNLIVQTTSAGMSPDIEGDPLPDYVFSGMETVYDIIYTPAKSRFLQRAEEAGCTVIGGSEMLQRQAELQFSLFTGFPFPKDPERRGSF
jgi:3-dehydroquinate dehydratase/shikimate dehydrogenase